MICGSAMSAIRCGVAPAGCGRSCQLHSLGIEACEVSELYPIFPVLPRTLPDGTFKDRTLAPPDEQYPREPDCVPDGESFGGFAFPGLALPSLEWSPGSVAAELGPCLIEEAGFAVVLVVCGTVRRRRRHCVD